MNTSTALMPDADFNATVALDDLLADVGLSVADTGGRVSFTGQDPIIAARHRLGAAIGIPMMGNAVAAAAMHRLRGGSAQDLHLDLRQAIHHINPSFGWNPTLAGEFPSIALFFDNPFGLVPAPHPRRAHHDGLGGVSASGSPVVSIPRRAAGLWQGR